MIHPLVGLIIFASQLSFSLEENCLTLVVSTLYQANMFSVDKNIVGQGGHICNTIVHNIIMVL